MKKRIVLITMALLMLITSVAFADSQPVIKTAVGREVCLDIPQSKFSDGVFMVPVRRICEIFDATCDWYEEERRIIINTPDGITRLFLYIDRDTFRIFTFTGVASGEGINLELEAPLEIVNDRTLVPFEQICKALKGEVTWSDDRATVTVTTPEKEIDTKAEIYITADKEDIASGEEIELTVMAKNSDIVESYGLSGYSIAIVYDKSQFEYIGSTLVDAVGNTVDSVNLENASFTNDSAKAVCLAEVPFDHNNDEVVIGKVMLKALTDNGGEIRLSNRVYTVGDDTLLVYTEVDGENMAVVNRGSMLKIHTEPIILK